MSIKLKLIKGLSYTNFDESICIKKDNPFCFVDDEKIAKKAVESGYFIIVDSSKSIDYMTKQELSEYAESNDIDIVGLKTKDDIRTKLKELLKCEF